MVNKKADGDEILDDSSVSGRSVAGGQQADMGQQPVHSEPMTAGETSMGLDENIASALAYLLGIVTGVLFFVLESENRFVRFHAAQSMVVFGGIFVASIALSILGGVITAIAFNGGIGGALIGGLLSLVLALVWLGLSLGALVTWVYLMFKAYRGETPRVPIAAGIADNLVNYSSS